jgi:hypothetical protein
MTTSFIIPVLLLKDFKPWYLINEILSHRYFAFFAPSLGAPLFIQVEQTLLALHRVNL